MASLRLEGAGKLELGGLPVALAHTLIGTWAGIQEGTADSLICPGGDGPAAEGSLFTGLAGFQVVGEAMGLRGRCEHSIPLQPLLSEVLSFTGAAFGQVGTVLLEPQTEGVGPHDRCQECDHL